MTAACSRSPHPSDDDGRTCARTARDCAGLCCVAPAFAASADFAIDKPAGVAVPEPAGRLPLRHPRRAPRPRLPRLRGVRLLRRRPAAHPGHLRRAQSGGRTRQLAAAQFAVLPVMRQLHEILWYLAEAAALPAAAPLHAEVGRAAGAHRASSPPAPPTSSPRSTSARYRREVGELLGRVSERVRPAVRARPDRRGADLMGRDLRGRELRGASLRGAYLIGADLRGVDLRDGGPAGRRPARRRRPRRRPGPVPVPDPAAGRGARRRRPIPAVLTARPLGREPTRRHSA